MVKKHVSLCHDLLVVFAADSQFIHALKNSFTKQSKNVKTRNKIFGLFQHEMPVRLIKLRWRSLSDSFRRARKFSSTSKFSQRKSNFLEHERETTLKRQPIHVESNFPRSNIEVVTPVIWTWPLCSSSTSKRTFPIVEQINADFHETQVAARTPSCTSEAQVSKFESEGRTKPSLLGYKTNFISFSYI